MAPAPHAFLSYTRKDDELFASGYITAFRKVLENAVQVVTGDRNFEIFQDKEGIVIGENWQRSLAEAIRDSSFFVPMLSPLFFTSDPCREEVRQFLEHERALNRDDLILPIYFVASAKVEKEEEKDKDPLVKELVKRQMFDWRENAYVPLQDPAAHKPMLELARRIGKAIERLDGAEAVTRGAETGVRIPSLKLDSELNLKREVISPHVVLWVDDNPDNNKWERHALESYGVRFLLALTTDEAVRSLQERGDSVAAIISDLGRPGDREAGFTLLEKLRGAAIDAPYFIFTSRNGTRHEAKALALGAQGLTADSDVLVAMVLAAISKKPS
jgi:CheY-like chemotaxis protein